MFVCILANALIVAGSYYLYIYGDVAYFISAVSSLDNLGAFMNGSVTHCRNSVQLFLHIRGICSTSLLTNALIAGVLRRRGDA